MFRVKRPLYACCRTSIIVLLWLCGSGLVVAEIYEVNTTEDTVDKSLDDKVCEDNVTGACSLRAAIQEANAQDGMDTIKLGAFTYELTRTGVNEDAAATGDLDILDDLIIEGAGKNMSIIDGGGGDRVFHIPEDTTVTMSGITVRDGFLAGPTADLANRGGAIYVGYNSTLTLSNCSISNNYAYSGGGISLFAYSTLDITDCIISENKAINGGGVYIAAYSSATINASTVSDNEAEEYGGGISNGGNNDLARSSATITDSTLEGNVARFGGGASNSFASNIIFDRSVIHNNEAESGGALYQRFTNSSIVLKNTTISGNRATMGNGGGLHGAGSLDTLTITSSTITDNSAMLGRGGGVINFSGNVSMHNSILAGNGDAGNLAPDCGNTITSQGYNILGSNIGCSFNATTGDSIGTSASPINASLAPLADNGGATLTHALLNNSLAIDNGNPAPPGSGNVMCELTDQRGINRNDGGICDAGAYEVIGDADLWLSFNQASNMIEIDGTLAQSVQIGNEGPYNANNLSVEVTLPVGSENKDTTGEGWNCTSAANLITCNSFSLAATKQTNINVIFWPPNGVTTLVTLAKISATTQDPLQSNNEAELSIEIEQESPADTETGAGSSNINSEQGGSTDSHIGTLSDTGQDATIHEKYDVTPVLSDENQLHVMLGILVKDNTGNNKLDKQSGKIISGKSLWEEVNQSFSDFALPNINFNYSDILNSLVAIGGVVLITAGLINLYWHSATLLGVFFAFPLFSPVDPIPVVLIAEKQRRLRKMRSKRDKELEDNDESIGKLFED